MDIIQKPERLYIEKDATGYELTQKIVSRLGSVPIKMVDDYKLIGAEKTFTKRADQDKNSLTLAVKNGELVKSIGRMESGQYYLFHEIDCRYDCEYCYLQYYFQTKTPVIFVNRDDVLKKIEEILRTGEHPYFHAGEVCDALAFDDLTGFSLNVIDLFGEHQNGTIEFRTKSTKVANLISAANPPRNVIPSWTFSPEEIAFAIEHKTHSFKERLEAAKLCQDAGYTIGVRLDPIIRISGWEKHYKHMLEDLLITLDTKQIDYITLGMLKHNKVLFEAIKRRFPTSPTILGEIFPSGEGKYKYLKFLRIDTYRKMVSWIREIDKNLRIELSLESKDVAAAVF